MRTKLLILDAVLVAVVAYAGVQFRNQWRSTKARETANLRTAQKALAAPPFSPLPVPPPVTPSNYAAVAMKTLFHPSRNPDVPIDAPPPPPPKPMPELPVYHGVMNLGDGLIAVLSVNAVASQRAVRPGETIGQFKLLDVNTNEIVFEWDGKEVRKRLDEVRGHAEAPQPVAVEARTEAPAPAAPPPPAKAGPGADTSFGFKICNINDGQAEGAVMEGYRKVVYTTPFGKSCRWEPAR